MARDYSFIKLLRLEPYVFLTVFGAMIRSSAISQLTQDKVCVVSRGHSVEVCKSLHQESFKTQLNDVLPETNDYILYEKFIVNGPCVLLMFFVGTWIDKYRGAVKFLLLLTSVASIMESIILYFNAYYFNWPTWALLIAFLPPALSGGRMITIMTAQTQSTKETPQKYLSMRIALIQFCVLLATSFAGLVIGPLLKLNPLGNPSQPSNYTGLLVFCSCCDLIAIVWISITYKVKKQSDTKGSTTRWTDVELSDPAETRMDTRAAPKPKREAKKSICGRFIELWDVRNVTEAFRIAIKKRPNYGRLKLLLLILTSCVVITNIMGPRSFQFQFTETALGWDIHRYNVVTSIVTFISTPVGFLVVPLLVKGFKVKDVTLGIIGSTSLLLSQLLRGMYTTDLGYYISHFVGALSGLAGIAVRALIKPLVLKNELGRLFIFVHVSEVFVDMALSPVITKIFNATLVSMPGFIFIWLAYTVQIPVIAFVFMRLIQPKGEEKVEEEEEKEEEAENKVDENV